MQTYPITVVLRHHKERLSKCSLRGLEGREDFSFFRYPCTPVPNVSGYVLLAIDAPPLSLQDSDRGLLVLDATWRYADRMHRDLEPQLDVVRRSIPAGARTAYPRRQDDCPDAEAGLASIEAIYLAYMLMGRSTEGLLDAYHWKEQFLELNAAYGAQQKEERC